MFGSGSHLFYLTGLLRSAFQLQFVAVQMLQPIMAAAILFFNLASMLHSALQLRFVAVHMIIDASYTFFST